MADIQKNPNASLSSDNNVDHKEFFRNASNSGFWSPESDAPDFEVPSLKFGELTKRIHQTVSKPVSMVSHRAPFKRSDAVVAGRFRRQTRKHPLLLRLWDIPNLMWTHVIFEAQTIVWEHEAVQLNQ